MRKNWIGVGITGLSMASTIAYFRETNKEINDYMAISESEERSRLFRSVEAESTLALSGYSLYSLYLSQHMDEGCVPVVLLSAYVFVVHALLSSETILTTSLWKFFVYSMAIKIQIMLNK